MTQFRTVGPSMCRTPRVSAPAWRRRSIASAGKSAPQRATIATSRNQVRTAAETCTELPPRVPIRLLPSAWITSSMVRLPMTITGRMPAAPRSPAAGITSQSRAAGAKTLALLRGDFLIGEVHVDAAAPVVEQRAEVPEDARGDHAEHELHRQVRGNGELGADRLVEDEHHHQAAKRDHSASPGKRHGRDAE